jgi:hypothetical protein
MDFMYSKVWNYLDDGHLIIPDDKKGKPYDEALWLWKELQIRTSDPQMRGQFESTLSEHQSKVWNILDDWWNGRYQKMKPDGNLATLNLLKAEEQKQEGNPQDPGNSTYHSSLPYLFVVEMVWYASVGQLNQVPAESMPPRMKAIVQEIKDKINLARSRALKSTTWQVIAYSSFQEIAGASLSDSEKVATSPTLEPCPWLCSKGKSAMRKPFYLWDRVSQKTVESSSLKEGHQKYYCISHTWGRWRRKSIQVPGVPWPVPTNTRFDVLSLPATFSHLNWPVQYIWFDLFCIPQEECPQQAEEIGKQAEIFRQAQGSVIWMHDVVEWKLLENAILWLGLNHLRRTAPEDEEVQLHYNCFTKELNYESSSLAPPTTLLNPWAPVPVDQPDGSSHEETQQKDPGSRWFSSLWTLQEAYLCPSALLADRNWKFLSVGNRLLLTLDSLASLAYSPASDIEDPANRPGAVEVLMFTIKRWELSDLASPSRMSLLIAAESRESTGPRAEAIMSAVGVTHWFESFRLRHGRAPPQQNLVFGLYPLEFLIEAQRKIGGPFFLHHRAPENTIKDAELGEPLGTMLPLAYNKKHWQVTQAMNFSTTNWSTSLSDSWEIQLEGSVAIKDAVILAGTEIQQPGNADGPISVSSPNGYKHFESFSAWMKGLPDVPCRFAVAVVRYSHRQFGIILEGVPSRSDQSRLTLVKTGIFMTDGRWCGEDLMTISPVNWVVL